MNGWKKAAWGVAGSLLLLLIVTSAVALIDGQSHISVIEVDYAIHHAEERMEETFVRQDVYEVQQEKILWWMERIDRTLEDLKDD